MADEAKKVNPNSEGAAPGVEAVVTEEKSKDGKKPIKIKRGKKKTIKQVTIGNAYIKATYNNTIVTITDQVGNAIGFSSAGLMGFKGAKNHVVKSRFQNFEQNFTGIAFGADSGVVITPHLALQNTISGFGFLLFSQLHTITGHPSTLATGRFLAMRSRGIVPLDHRAFRCITTFAFQKKLGAHSTATFALWINISRHTLISLIILIIKAFKVSLIFSLYAYSLFLPFAP